MLEFIAARGSASFLQTPAWARVKSEWRGERVGFYDGDELTGVGLILYRKLPKLPRYLAYLPEGPVLDWSRDDIGEHLDALIAHVKKRQTFAVRIGPAVVHRVWGTKTIKNAIADDAVTSLTEVEPDVTTVEGQRVISVLKQGGWVSDQSVHGFTAGQPQFNFQLPLRYEDGTQKTEDEILKGMNQLWRRNIKKATKLGVEVRLGTREDLQEFHKVYLETAERDGFTGRPLEYFERMWDVLNAEQQGRMQVFLAEHDGDVVAATTFVTVGEHAWYSYGASTTAKREVRGSNAIQWAMIRAANDAGCAVYDMRGIVAGVASDDPEIGLIQFKVGSGGQAVAFPGEWDKPINPILYKAFDLYMKRR
ncbi:peptidoglycan bridge formation glycyltransferase FemA/FemB family protein [Cutibacterium equinum]|uniref:Peptidoglycan bridge formation glycyltransferase FemA/FemB family protein n=2 Tax=Cutibacterium equinum TaxID=3016342 RepID=A0ABY7R1T0_9ACTN|nr:peptidoglycan bridge formation glycyltransferase FemA/FemB family protein [Cutibacterium equinum]WCC81217.1 peptidoglycan bridge formation glycyltransferase FemA/FemB family protein [Cutibacterium equinum]